MKLLSQVLHGRPNVLIIDETGDAKKGKSTDYVKRQYIGNLGKVENGIVAVRANFTPAATAKLRTLTESSPSIP